MGLLLGLWEARLLFFVPSVREFVVVDATWAIWFLAPLVDMALFAVVGAILGFFAALGKEPSPRRSAMLAAVLVACAGAHIGWAGHFLYSKSVIPEIYSRWKDLLFPLVRFGIVLAVALVVAHLFRDRLLRWFSLEKAWPLRRMTAALLAVVILLAGGIVFYAVFPPGPGTHAARRAPVLHRPNVVLITMDTVRADHLSAYGYDRKTTPNLDRFAARGVLFQNAIAATSWTLPSLASIFTGLLPHQNGANAFRIMNTGWADIGSVLEKHGYQTAGFNANIFYGQAGWGLGHGFDFYDDDPTTLGYNLGRTLVGRTIIQPLYQEFGTYNAFFRRDAGQLNADVFRWLRNRPSGPFYLYINYFDAHSPYIAPAPYDRRFGKMPEAVLQRWGFAVDLHPAEPVPASQKAGLVDGYDDSLSYIDAQIGKLVHALEATPGWKNTIVIVTADHGEAFGEHGSFQHGCDLHREEIHVPLIVFGSGIPSGRRILPAVPIRDLFSTVLDLALGPAVPMHQTSLARFWEDNPSSVLAPPVVSELSASRVKQDTGEISLTTAQWHYLLKLNGQQQLYDWATDPGERHNLSSLARYQKTLAALRAQLQEIEANSTEPWLGREYLFALGASRAPLSSNPASSRSSTSPPEPVGSAQDYFRPSVSLAEEGPSKSEKEILKSLPYQ